MAAQAGGHFAVNAAGDDLGASRPEHPARCSKGVSVNLQERWFDEVWNKGNENAIDQMLAPGALAHGLVDPAGHEVSGVLGFKLFWRAMRSAFSGIRVDVQQTVGEGDLLVARFVVTGRHTGDGLPFAPKGNLVKFTGMSMVRVQNGKIAESWNNVDFMAMYQQLQETVRAA
jgi:predicted ester cyclase